WHAPTTTYCDRRRIVRLLIERVEVSVHGTTEEVDVSVQWSGGFASRLLYSARKGVVGRKDGQAGNSDSIVNWSPELSWWRVWRRKSAPAALFPPGRYAPLDRQLRQEPLHVACTSSRGCPQRPSLLLHRR